MNLDNAFKKSNEIIQSYTLEFRERDEFRQRMRMRAEQTMAEEKRERIIDRSLERELKLADIALRKKGVETLDGVMGYLQGKAIREEMMLQQKRAENIPQIAPRDIIDSREDSATAGPNLLHRLTHPISEIINTKIYEASPKRFAETTKYVPWILPYIDKLKQVHKSVSDTELIGHFIWTDLKVTFSKGGEMYFKGLSRANALQLKSVIDQSGPNYFLG